MYIWYSSRFQDTFLGHFFIGEFLLYFFHLFIHWSVYVRDIGTEGDRTCNPGDTVWPNDSSRSRRKVSCSRKRRPSLWSFSVIRICVLQVWVSSVFRSLFVLLRRPSSPKSEVYQFRCPESLRLVLLFCFSGLRLPYKTSSSKLVTQCLTILLTISISTLEVKKSPLYNSKICYPQVLSLQVGR